MKFKVKKNNNREEYDELLYILENIKKIHKNPYRKAKLFIKNYIMVIIFSVLLLIIDLFLLKNGKFWYLYLGIIIMMIFLLLIILLNGIKRIKFYQKNSSDSIINVSNDEIIIEYKDCSYNYKWNDIKYIIANKYSICIIPIKLPGLVICFPIESKNDIIKMINKYNKKSLFIDNKDLYN